MSKSAITSKRYVIGCQLLLITNRKSHTPYGLSIVTDIGDIDSLNDLERGNSPFCIISPNLIALHANYVTVVEYRPIMSAK